MKKNENVYEKFLKESKKNTKSVILDGVGLPFWQFWGVVCRFCGSEA